MLQTPVWVIEKVFVMLAHCQLLFLRILLHCAVFQFSAIGGLNLLFHPPPHQMHLMLDL